MWRAFGSVSSGPEESCEGLFGRIREKLEVTQLSAICHMDEAAQESLSDRPPTAAPRRPREGLRRPSRNLTPSQSLAQRLLM